MRGSKIFSGCCMNGQIRRSQREQQQPSPPPPDILQLSFPPTPPPLSHLTLLHSTSNRFNEGLFHLFHYTLMHHCAQKKGLFPPSPGPLPPIPGGSFISLEPLPSAPSSPSSRNLSPLQLAISKQRCCPPAISSSSPNNSNIPL